MENEDPNLYRAIIESLRVSTGDPEYYPHRTDMTVSILDIAKPAKIKKNSQTDKLGEITQSSIQDSFQTLKVVPEEEFEIWEDDIFEGAISEDDWEEIFDEQRVDTPHLSCSAVLRGNGDNG